jgi:pimeloyl-ACP methyl ester carboxylesterase
VYFGLCLLLFFTQRSLIYYPQPRHNTDGVAPLILHNDGESILASTRPHDGDAAVIYFGGNAEDVSLDLPIYAAAFPDRAIYMLHYRGYGGSSGKPTEQGIVSDALTLFDLVHGQHSRVILVGRSLGSGVAVQIAAARLIERLVLITPYNGLVDAAAHAYPYLPNGLLLRDKYESLRYAPQVRAPTLILAAGNDEVIPATSTERLRAQFAASPVHYVVISGAGHNSISDSPNYMPLIQSG